MYSARRYIPAVTLLLIMSSLSGTVAFPQAVKFIRHAADPLPLANMLVGRAPCARDSGSAVTAPPAATAATAETIDEVFHEAMRSYEKALKSGIQLQEESVNLWKDLLTKLGSPEEFQAKLESMTADAFPKARQRIEEFVETFNRTSNQTIDLFEKTLGVYQATSVPEAQRRVQDLVESSLSALRVNVHSALNTNAKIIASWKELVDRFGPAVK